LDELEDIIKGCRDSDRRSQENLYRKFYPALFALCKRYFTDNHDIITALNSGMLKVYMNIAQYDDAKGDFFNWMYTIVRNAALTLIRDQKTDYTVELEDSVLYIPDPSISEASSLEDVYTSLEVLPPTTRAVCTLFYLENYSLKEIAPLLDMKEGTVKWHLHEGRKKLKSVFQNDQLNQKKN